MAGTLGQQRKSWNEYLMEFSKIHGKYEYRKPTVSNFSTLKIDIKCPKHGWFKQLLQSHRRGSLCPMCSNENRTYRKRQSINVLMDRFKKTHGDKYEYDMSYSGRIKTDKIRICCDKHGWFEQTPGDHVNGAGCPGCKSKTLSDLYTKSFEEFVQDARNVHGEIYEYHSECYINRLTKTTITCPKHGDFEKTPSDHIHSKIGCPVCSAKSFTSNLEIEWLDSLGLPNDNQHRQAWIQTVNGKKKVDGFCEQTNTVYLFHGDYWHGNPRVYKASEKNPNVGKTFKNLFEATKRYEEDIIRSGYNLVVMWESDYRANK